MLQAEEVAGAKAGASWFVSGKAQSRAGGVSEQLIRGLIDHYKDFGLDPEMLHPWKWTCSDLDLTSLALLLVENRLVGAVGAGRPARRHRQEARWEMDQAR